MPSKITIQRARKDARQGKAPSTQAGEFVREEIEHVRQGKHGARNAKQAIAIGLSKARRSGVELPPPKKGASSSRTRRQAQRDLEKGESGGARRPSPRRSRAVRGALKREGHQAAAPASLSRQARSSARRRGLTTHAKSAGSATKKKTSPKRGRSSKRSSSSSKRSSR